MEMVVTFPGNKRVDSTYKGFTVHTDQPLEEGGEGSAPEPFDLFLSSIGTCAGIYVLSFCRERGIDTRGLEIVLDFDRNEKTWMVERIRIRIVLPPGVPEKYRKALVRTAGLCTVKKHLVSPPAFEITTVDAEPQN